MLFHEFYGVYFHTLTRIVQQALAGTLTDKQLSACIVQTAFSESLLFIPQALKDKRWPLLTPELKTILRHSPEPPLTTLQERWLKALLTDPRIKLFAPQGTLEKGLEHVVPLFSSDTFIYFDRNTRGDPFQDPDYIAHFQTILTALREHKKLNITITGHIGKSQSVVCVPHHLEYSAKDDKFRLITLSPAAIPILNLDKIKACALFVPYNPQAYADLPSPRQHTLVLELEDKRNALERALLHFSPLKKETEQLDSQHYRITLHYRAEDATEILIRILSFGPIIRVISPESVVLRLKKRLEKQYAMQNANGSERLRQNTRSDLRDPLRDPRISQGE